MPRKKKDLYEDGKFHGMFNVKALEGALIELHDKDGLPMDVVRKILENALLDGYKKWWCQKNGFSTKDKDAFGKTNVDYMKATISVDWKSGVIHLCNAWDILPTDDDIEDDFYQIDLERANEIGIPEFRKQQSEALTKEAKDLKKASKNEEDPEKAQELLAESSKLEQQAEDMLKIEVGGLCEEEIDPTELDDMFVRRVVGELHQAMRAEAKRTLMDSVSALLNHNIVGKVVQADGNPGQMRIDADFGKAHATLERQDLLPDDNFKAGDEIRAFLSGVEEKDGTPLLKVSRTSEGYVRALYENEIPEMADGTVRVVKIARQAGIRTKMMVASNNPNVSATGALLGQGAIRSRNILNELGRETVDISEYTKDPVLNILNALKPAEIVGLKFPPEGMPNEPIYAICANFNKKVAVGKAGCNVRLAGRLVGHDIRIMEIDAALADKVSFTPVSILEKEAKERLARLEPLNEEQKVIEEPGEEIDETVNESSTNVEENAFVPAEAIESAEAIRSAEFEEKSSKEDTENSMLGEKIEQMEAHGELPEQTAVETTKAFAPEEHVEITGKAKFDLSELEKRIENDREKDKNKGNYKSWSKNKPEKKKEETKEDTTKTPVNAMPIYTDQELKDFEEEDDSFDKYDNDYDEEYDDDSYYDDDKR